MRSGVSFMGVYDAEVMRLPKHSREKVIQGTLCFVRTKMYYRKGRRPDFSSLLPTKNLNMFPFTF